MWKMFPFDDVIMYESKLTETCVIFVMDLFARCTIEDHVQPFAINDKLHFQYILGCHHFFFEFRNILYTWLILYENIVKNIDF